MRKWRAGRFWLSMQRRNNLWEAMRSPKERARIEHAPSAQGVVIPVSHDGTDNTVIAELGGRSPPGRIPDAAPIWTFRSNRSGLISQITEPGAPLGLPIVSAQIRRRADISPALKSHSANLIAASSSVA